EVVGSVDDDVEVAKDGEGVGRGQTLGERRELHMWVDVAQARPRRFGLRAANAGRAVEDVAWQVAEIDQIEVHQSQRAHTGRGEIQRRRRPQSARADKQDACVTQFRLAFETYIGKREVPGVPQQLLMRQRRQWTDATPAI